MVKGNEPLLDLLIFVAMLPPSIDDDNDGDGDASGGVGVGGVNDATCAIVSFFDDTTVDVALTVVIAPGDAAAVDDDALAFFGIAHTRTDATKYNTIL